MKTGLFRKKVLRNRFREAPDFIVGQNGERIRSGDNVVCSHNDTAYGIGVVKMVDPLDQIAVVRLYPWLSPDWDGEVHTFPSSWLSLDYEYEKWRECHGIVRCD